jgi:hypothetical protein
METAQTLGRGLSFEEVWAIVQENAQGLKELRESQKETAQIVKETAQQMQETDRRLAQQMQETDKRLAEQYQRLDKQLGKLGNRFGEMVEYMVVPNLVAKFEELGFTFTKANRTEIKDKAHNIFTEVDALLENGDKVMAVEIKTKPNNDDINDHLERMGKLRNYADLHDDKRIYLGAIAGVVFSGSEKIYALKNGLYVIEPSGDTFNITEPKGDYHPHEW